MFSSGGGGGLSMPRVDDPLEFLIVLLILGALIWLGSRFFST